MLSSFDLVFVAFVVFGLGGVGGGGGWAKDYRDGLYVLWLSVSCNKAVEITCN